MTLKERREELLKSKKGNTGYPSIDKPWNKGHSYFEVHPVIPNLSVYNALRIVNVKNGKKEAVDSLKNQITYNELFDDSVTISRALKELGIKKGDIVSVAVPNLYQAIAISLACNRIGAVCTMINSNSRLSELCDYLNLYESKVLIDFDRTKEDNDYLMKNSKLNYIVSIDAKDVNNIKLGTGCNICNKDIINYNELGDISKYQKSGIPSNDPNADAFILYTSGSTGKPKSVELTNKNILAAATYLKNSSNANKNLKGMRILGSVPFMYPYGYFTSMLTGLLIGNTVIMAPNLTQQNISYYMNKKPNMIYGNGTVLDIIMKNVPEDCDLSSVKYFVAGGDFMSSNHATTGEEFFKAHGAKDPKVLNGAGNAETSSCGTNPVGVEQKKETAGKILTGIDAVIIDEKTGKEKKYNEVGSLLVNGAHVFKHYYKNPNATNDAFVEYNGEKYLKTTMMGSIDPEGYFKLTGRESRFYIPSCSQKVYTGHVQSVLSHISEIKDIAVVRIKDDETFLSGIAYVVLKDGIEPSEELKNKLLEKFNNPIKDSDDTYELKWYEVPKHIKFVSSLPKMQSGKIDYASLENDADAYYEKLKENENEKTRSLKK